jgi:integrase
LRSGIFAVMDKKRGPMVPNIEDLVFTRADGRAIDKDMITGALKRARKKTGVKDFRFHDYRDSAKTNWSRRNIHADIAMLAAPTAPCKCTKDMSI